MVSRRRVYLYALGAPGRGQHGGAGASAQRYVHRVSSGSLLLHRAVESVDAEAHAGVACSLHRRVTAGCRLAIARNGSGDVGQAIHAIMSASSSEANVRHIAAKHYYIVSK